MLCFGREKVLPFKLTTQTDLPSEPGQFHRTTQLSSLNSLLSVLKGRSIYGQSSASADSLTEDAEDVETVGSGYGSMSSVLAAADDSRIHVPHKDTNIRQQQVETGSAPTVPRMNLYGKYICDYPNCDDFKASRRCEWKKHVDKHYRPHRCLDTVCAASKGFTSSGGLLRHEREVHNKHGGPKTQLACTYPDCKRKNKLFTRKENLNGHLRRVHQHAERSSGTNDPAIVDEAQVDDAGTRASQDAETANNTKDFIVVTCGPKRPGSSQDLNGRPEARPFRENNENLNMQIQDIERRREDPGYLLTPSSTELTETGEIKFAWPSEMRRSEGVTVPMSPMKDHDDANSLNEHVFAVDHHSPASGQIYAQDGSRFQHSAPYRVNSVDGPVADH